VKAYFGVSHSDTVGTELRNHTILTFPLKGNMPTVKISQISIIMYPMRKSCISLATGLVLGLMGNKGNKAYLRPTAACFRSDRHNRYVVNTIAIPQRIIDPILC
jgi:hypothetical protein